MILVYLMCGFTIYQMITYIWRRNLQDMEDNVYLMTVDLRTRIRMCRGAGRASTPLAFSKDG